MNEKQTTQSASIEHQQENIAQANAFLRFFSDILEKFKNHFKIGTEKKLDDIDSAQVNAFLQQDFEDKEDQTIVEQMCAYVDGYHQDLDKIKEARAKKEETGRDLSESTWIAEELLSEKQRNSNTLKTEGSSNDNETVSKVASAIDKLMEEESSDQIYKDEDVSEYLHQHESDGITNYRKKL